MSALNGLNKASPRILGLGPGACLFLLSNMQGLFFVILIPSPPVRKVNDRAAFLDLVQGLKGLPDDGFLL